MIDVSDSAARTLCAIDTAAHQLRRTAAMMRASADEIDLALDQGRPPFMLKLAPGASEGDSAIHLLQEFHGILREDGSVLDAQDYAAVLKGKSWGQVLRDKERAVPQPVAKPEVELCLLRGPRTYGEDVLPTCKLPKKSPPLDAPPGTGGWMG
jgi:hypothetical protein